MADIKIDYDGLTQAASSLKNLATTYDGLCTRMKTMTGPVSYTHLTNGNRSSIPLS